MSFDRLIRLDVDGALEISESLVDVCIKCDLIDFLLDNAKEIFSACRGISERDRLEIFLEVDGYSDYDFSTLNETAESAFVKAIKDSNDNNVQCEFKIRKNVIDRSVSVYSPESFFGYLDRGDFLDIVRTLSGYIENGLIFEVFSDIQSFGSNGLIFCRCGENTSVYQTKNLDRNRQLSLLQENSVTHYSFNRLLPSDFEIVCPESFTALSAFFERYRAILSLMFLSSAFEINGDKISYKINGYKTVFCEAISTEKILGQIDSLYRIYSWAFVEKGGVDKIGLARNVLSIHIDSQGCVIFDDQAFNAISSNYQIYLKENVQSYLEVKNKIGEMIIDSTTRTYSLADELMESFKNNILVISTFVLSVVLVNGLKDSGAEKIFSGEYFGVVSIITTLSFIWLYVSRKGVLERFFEASISIKETLLSNYKNVIMDTEICDLVDPIIKRNGKYLRKQVDFYTNWWCVILVVFWGMYLLVYHVFKDG